MIRHEIQKACLSVMTDQHFDGLSAVGHSPQGYPLLPVPPAQHRALRPLPPLPGTRLRMAADDVALCPGLPRRELYWVRTLLRDDPDPAFADMLQAGAARALVPVRPGFEASVLSFMTDGTVPTLDALTEITEPPLSAAARRAARSRLRARSRSALRRPLGAPAADDTLVALRERWDAPTLGATDRAGRYRELGGRAWLFGAMRPPNEGLERRRRLYQERVVRRLIVKRPGWDAAWTLEARQALDKVHDESACRILGYQAPVVVADADVMKHGR